LKSLAGQHIYINMFRLKDFRKENKLSQKAVGDLFGCGQTNINAIESAEKDLTDEQLNILIEKFGKDYILSFVEKNERENDGEGGLPLIPFEFIAGFGEDNDGIMLNKCERYNIPEFKNIGAEFLVRVGGSSMYPKYSSGDLLACRKINDILFFQWGKVYVIDSSQGQLIKRVREHEDPAMIWLDSDNRERYAPFPIPKSDIQSLSVVVGAVRME